MTNHHSPTQLPITTNSTIITPQVVATRKAMTLIKSFEGLRLDAYICPGGVWSVGYGHVLRDGFGRMLTKASHASINDIPIRQRHINRVQAENFLEEDLFPLWQVVDRLFTIKLETHQVAALMSFAYNLGGGALRASTLRIMINQQRPQEIKKQWQRWVFANGQRLQGLVKRRRAEMNIFFATIKLFLALSIASP